MIVFLTQGNKKYLGDVMAGLLKDKKWSLLYSFKHYYTKHQTDLNSFLR